MAGSAFRLNPTHVFREPGREGFHRANLVEASLTMLGRSFRTTIHEGATTNELIEKVARENGGEVTKKYYPEFKTWEITSVRIGDAALVKSSDSGIHFSLGQSGIPMAATDDNGIVFPNGDELPIGPNIRNIALWTTSAQFDPGSVGDIDRMYKGRGGAIASQDALDEISRAHGGGRTGRKIVLEDNILVLNKDTGEILTVSQHASKEPEPAAFAPDSIMFSLPQYASSHFAAPEIRSFIPAQFDAFRNRLDIGRLIVRTFDGSIADVVRIQMNPFSQDKLDAGFARMPREQKMIPSPLANAGPVAQTPPPAFCMLRFGRENSQSDSGTQPSSPPPASPGAPRILAKRALWRSDGRTGPGSSQSPPQPRLKAISKTLPITYDAAAKAWNERRIEPLTLGTPVGAVSLKGPKTWKSGRNKSHPRKAWPMERVRHALALAGVLSIIARLLKERARKIAEGHNAKKAAKAIKAIEPLAKKPPLPASSVSAMVKNTRNELRRKDNRIHGRETLIKRAKPRTRRNPKAASTLQNTHAYPKGKPSRQAARLRRAQSGLEAIRPIPPGRKSLLIAKSRRKKDPSNRYFFDLLGFFRRKKRKITGRAWAGN